jgi:phytanoyl-CoA hydroxylase
MLDRAAYDRDGFAIFPGLLGGTLLAQLKAESDRVFTEGLAPDASSLFDYEPTETDVPRVVQRLRKPTAYAPFFMELARHPALLDLVEPLLGSDIRLHHSKINVKAPNVGSPLEWHQDWAFIPHTNDSLAIVSVFIDDCPSEKGPMQMIPGSHRGELHDHHHDGVFFGAIDPAVLDLASSVELPGPAGTVTVHAPMTVHGSGFNRGRDDRRILFFEYAAADAWPLFYGVDYAEFDSRIVRGQPTNKPRLAPLYVKMPYPTAVAGTGKIYDQQQKFGRKHFR